MALDGVDAALITHTNSTFWTLVRVICLITRHRRSLKITLRAMSRPNTRKNIIPVRYVKLTTYLTFSFIIASKFVSKSEKKKTIKMQFWFIFQ